MNLTDERKKKFRKKLGKRIRRITFIMIKPFLPFIIVIGGIILAISTVSDAIFGKEEDSAIMKKLSSSNYEKQYAEWLSYSNAGGDVITDSSGLVPNGMFTWPVPGYTTITSNFGMRDHPVYHVEKMHTGIDVAAPTRS